MYKYPLTFSFSLFSILPKITVKDADGTVLLTASKRLLGAKDEVRVTANGQPAFTVISQENRIVDIPSNWDILAADGKKVGVVDDDFLSAVDTSKFAPDMPGSTLMDMEISRALNLRSVKMYWLKDAEGKKAGLVAPEQSSLMAMQLPFDRYIRQLPGILFRLITPRYYVRLGDETVMILQKKRTWMVDTYTLEMKAKFPAKDEALLINGVLLALVYERQRLKELYS